jgi:uncharacterized protein (TIGR02594 family)
VKAIRAYQRTIMKTPDGRVDPEGLTLTKLREEVSGAALQAEAAARSVMKAKQPGDGKPPWLHAFDGFQFSDLLSLLPATAPREPSWISVAEDELGTAEIDGKQHNPRILEYHRTTGSKATDENPWCASFVNWVLEKAGYEGTDSAWSHSWRKWGDGIAKPALGAVAFIDWGKVYASKQGKGHVGFVVGKTADGRIVLLGGNQSGKVRYSGFRTDHIEAYRVPKGFRVDAKLYDLPLLKVSKGGSGFESTR